MKAVCQYILKQLRLYQRVKSSRLYDWYWSIADGRLIEARDAEIRFFRQTLAGFRDNDLIFDIGANQGQKTDIFLRLGARVVAVDPDRTNQEVLRQRFLTYRFHPCPVSIIGKAVSDRTCVQTMWVDEPGSAKNTLNPKWVDTLRQDSKRFGTTLSFNETVEIETITLEELIAAHGRPIYIKIDVEGHEPSVLRGMKHRVPYLSFEVNLPEFKGEGLRCIDILSNIAPEGEFNYAVDCNRGLRFDKWMSQREFAHVFEQCNEPSIEVFWRTAVCA